MLTLAVECIDRHNAMRVGMAVTAALSAESPVLIDLGRLRYFDVRGFVAILKWIATGKSVRLCSLDPNIHTLFELLRAHSSVPLYRTREEALASFRQPEYGVRTEPGIPSPVGQLG